ncbi:MAG TPA: AAA family ATPase [Hyphomicrobium sp.]|nr:AAA family ATPase [Hyphomicrobium sp.]
MLFWRTKTAKPSAETEPSETPVVVVADASSIAAGLAPASDETTSAADSSSSDEAAVVVQPDAEAPHHDGKVITLSTVRLADRLADLNSKAERDGHGQAVDTPTLAANETRTFGDAVSALQGQAALRRSLDTAGISAHVLIVGPAGSGRRDAAISVAKQIASSRTPSNDWIYVANGTAPGVLKAYPVPAGTGERIVHDVQDALAKSAAMLTRLVASDSHQMSRTVLEEDHRQRSDGGIEQLKRRAEAQNIALVRTSEGFVLAPMHDGRVVRSDVFRALPDALQRDVESKISTLEGELQQVLGALTSADIATDDRHLALSHQTAERAVKPNLSMARKLFANGDAIGNVFDVVEGDWTRRAAEAVRRDGASGTLALPGLHAISAEKADGAPVVVAHAVTATSIVGEIGRDANGSIAIRPGYLSRASGGFLIIDAWRLAADAQAWSALSAALETGTVQPMPSSGLAVTADPVPLNTNVLIVAERRSLARLRAIDPRLDAYFHDVVAFDVAAKPVSAMGVAL